VLKIDFNFGLLFDRGAKAQRRIKMKKYIFATLPICLGILCLVTKGIIGDELMADGTIVERNFFLIPLSYLFFLSGIISFLFVAILSRKTNIAN